MAERNALITGASRGIGRAIVDALAGPSWSLDLVARSEEGLAAVAESSRGAGAEVRCHAADLGRSAGVEQLLAQLGGAPDLIVHNAGTAPTARFAKTGDEVLEEVLALHLWAPFRIDRHFAAELRERGSGCIVHMGSTAGLRSFPYTSAYTSGKHALIGLTRALHQELGPAGISVYAPCPGFVDTDITRQAAAAVAARSGGDPDKVLAQMAAQNRIGRMHTADEVAQTVRRLWEERPAGCILDLDHDPVRWVDDGDE